MHEATEPNSLHQIGSNATPSQAVNYSWVPNEWTGDDGSLIQQRSPSCSGASVSTEQPAPQGSVSRIPRAGRLSGAAASGGSARLVRQGWKAGNATSLGDAVDVGGTQRSSLVEVRKEVIGKILPELCDASSWRHPRHGDQVMAPEDRLYSAGDTGPRRGAAVRQPTCLARAASLGPSHRGTRCDDARASWTTSTGRRAATQWSYAHDANSSLPPQPQQDYSSRYLLPSLESSTQTGSAVSADSFLHTHGSDDPAGGAVLSGGKLCSTAFPTGSHNTMHVSSHESNDVSATDPTPIFLQRNQLLAEKTGGSSQRICGAPSLERPRFPPASPPVKYGRGTDVAAVSAGTPSFSSFDQYSFLPAQFKHDRTRKQAAAFIRWLVVTQLGHSACPGVRDLVGPPPSSSIYPQLLTFLFAQLDPTINLTPFEEQVPKLFKDLGAPFKIVKSHVVSHTNPLTWPQHLAALTWICCLLFFDRKLALGRARAISAAWRCEGAGRSLKSVQALARDGTNPESPLLPRHSLEGPFPGASVSRCFLQTPRVAQLGSARLRIPSWQQGSAVPLQNSPAGTAPSTLLLASEGVTNARSSSGHVVDADTVDDTDNAATGDYPSPNNVIQAIQEVYLARRHCPIGVHPPLTPVSQVSWAADNPSSDATAAEEFLESACVSYELVVARRQGSVERRLEEARASLEFEQQKLDQIDAMDKATRRQLRDIQQQERLIEQLETRRANLNLGEAEFRQSALELTRQVSELRNHLARLEKQLDSQEVTIEEYQRYKEATEMKVKQVEDLRRQRQHIDQLMKSTQERIDATIHSVESKSRDELHALVDTLVQRGAETTAPAKSVAIPNASMPPNSVGRFRSALYTSLELPPTLEADWSEITAENIQLLAAARRRAREATLRPTPRSDRAAPHGPREPVSEATGDPTANTAALSSESPRSKAGHEDFQDVVERVADSCFRNLSPRDWIAQMESLEAAELEQASVLKATQTHFSDIRRQLLKTRQRKHSIISRENQEAQSLKQQIERCRNELKLEKEETIALRQEWDDPSGAAEEFKRAQAAMELAAAQQRIETLRNQAAELREQLERTQEEHKQKLDLVASKLTVEISRCRSKLESAILQLEVYMKEELVPVADMNSDAKDEAAGLQAEYVSKTLLCSLSGVASTAEPCKQSTDDHPPCNTERVKIDSSWNSSAPPSGTESVE